MLWPGGPSSWYIIQFVKQAESGGGSFNMYTFSDEVLEAEYIKLICNTAVRYYAFALGHKMAMLVKQHTLHNQRHHSRNDKSRNYIHWNF